MNYFPDDLGCSRLVKYEYLPIKKIEKKNSQTETSKRPMPLIHFE